MGLARRIARGAPVPVAGRTARATPVRLARRAARAPVRLARRIAREAPARPAWRTARATPLRLARRAALAPVRLAPRIAREAPARLAGRTARATPLRLAPRTARTTPVRLAGRAARHWTMGTGSRRGTGCRVRPSIGRAGHRMRGAAGLAAQERPLPAWAQADRTRGRPPAAGPRRLGAGAETAPWPVMLGRPAASRAGCARDGCHAPHVRPWPAPSRASRAARRG